MALPLEVEPQAQQRGDEAGLPQAGAAGVEAGPGSAAFGEFVRGKTILCKGDIWGELGKADLILVPGNSVLDARGMLVMGAGAALEAKKHFPDCHERLGAALRQSKGVCRDPYGVCVVLCPDTDGVFSSIGVFQSKSHWKHNSCLDLIDRSAYVLRREYCGYKRIAMCFPGIGLGGLNRADVLPILEKLPDNVFVYEKP